MGSCIISRLQMVVAREIDFKEPCAITCGYFYGRTDASIIPDFADFKVDIRLFDKDIEMDLDITADNFVLLGHPLGENPILYVYWNYIVTPREDYDRAEKDGTLQDLPFNYNVKFATETEPSFWTGIEGLAIGSVTFFES